MDKIQAMANICQTIKYIGDDPDREGVKETPLRVVKSYKEIFSGYAQNPADIMKTFNGDGYDEMIISKDIEYYSMCEHHMLPFFGKVHIAYIPNGKVIGLSKLSRLVDIYARRLQIQEKMTNQIAEALMTYLKPQGVGVVIEGKHLCMVMRGVQKQNSSMITSSIKGNFEEQKVREEFLNLTKKV